jgi:serine phosphatase RsbU (regulator of sigma subunit)
MEALKPEHMELFYSDGVVDARSPTGEFFGELSLLVIEQRPDDSPHRLVRRQPEARCRVTNSISRSTTTTPAFS